MGGQLWDGTSRALNNFVKQWRKAESCFDNITVNYAGVTGSWNL
jgi:hypothetical protein